MHDVLAHRLTILSVHAGALENAGDKLPPEYAETARVIRTSARTALEELREVIGLLRREETAIEPPQPTLEQLPALLDESRAAGLAIEYQPAETTTVPDLVGRTAYRAIQEGLTNARKHGAGDKVELTIEDGPPLVVELVSHGAGTATLPGSGTGLVGLAERVELAGGELTYGPQKKEPDRARLEAADHEFVGVHALQRVDRLRAVAVSLADIVESRDDGGAIGFKHAASLGCGPSRSHYPAATVTATKVALEVDVDGAISVT